jgi:hypothetical protein
MLRSAIGKTLSKGLPRLKMLNSILRRIGIYSGSSEPAVDPSAVFKEYCNSCHHQGINNLYFVLSFDCDTPADAPAARRLEEKLSVLGIKTTYAVPGRELLRGKYHYEKVAELGAHFINHGARPHADWRDGRYHSVTFYNEMTSAEVVRDIEEGHYIIERTLGLAPQGFRAPHFGYYQHPDQLAVIYETALRLGYTFCSTTMPDLGLAKGPVIKMDGLYEFPLSGSVRTPSAILDSWSYLSDYYNLILREEYFELVRETVDYFHSKQLPAVLNLYVDPSHVVDAEPFYKALNYLVLKGVKSVSFSELIDLVSVNRQA